MKVKSADPKRLDILGSGQASPNRELEAAALRLWQQKLGYFSLFAGFTTVFALQAQDVAAKDKDKTAVPPRIARQAAELVKKLNAGCSKPELLRHQSDYMLPGQKGKFNMLTLLTGGDNCPGTPIPAGTYTTGSPFTDTGTTIGANSTVQFVQAGCSDYEQVDGPDLIYSFKIERRGTNPRIQATTTSSNYDLSIYILNGATGTMCPLGPDADVTNCLQGSDSTVSINAGGSGVETITAAKMNALPLNTPLYLFVDSYYARYPRQWPLHDHHAGRNGPGSSCSACK